MSQRAPLTVVEKEQIVQARGQGKTLAEIAVALHCSRACVRKWWRQHGAEGRKGLRARRRGRGPSGLLAGIDARVRATALRLKRAHPGWGADRVMIELQDDQRLRKLRLPHRSQLTAFFKRCCPDCVKTYRPAPAPVARPAAATGVHEQWQLDCQEGLRLRNGHVATLCNIRDPVGAAMIASQAFQVTTARHWRKLSWTEVRQVLRSAFCEWKTLPDSVQTDNELGLAGAPTDLFPSRLTLWLMGLGIKHRFIRPGQPTDQPHIERAHRTLDGLALGGQALANRVRLQRSLDAERVVYNQRFPARASDCAGRPPLVAHPELLCPRRPYQVEWELALFEIQRVYAYLATFVFTRKVNSGGQISLGRVLYSLGRKFAGQCVKVRFDPARQEWVSTTTSESEDQVIRRPLQSLDIQELTGLDPVAQRHMPPVQLAFPGFVA